MRMNVKRLLLISASCVALGALMFGCGVNMVRPVTLNAHKRPTFSMEKVAKIATLEAGKGQNSSAAADIMALRLLDHGFDVVERARIKDVLAEANIVLSHEEDTKSASKIGNIVGADSILLISVSDYTSGQQMIPRGCMSAARIETVVNLGVTARLVDVKTAEVIWVGAASTQDISLHACLQRISDDFIKTITEK